MDMYLKGVTSTNPQFTAEVSNVYIQVKYKVDLRVIATSLKVIFTLKKLGLLEGRRIFNIGDLH